MKGWTQDPAKELHLEVDDTLLRNADLRPLTENCLQGDSTAPHGPSLSHAALDKHSGASGRRKARVRGNEAAGGHCTEPHLAGPGTWLGTNGPTRFCTYQGPLWRGRKTRHFSTVSPK